MLVCPYLRYPVFVVLEKTKQQETHPRYLPPFGSPASRRARGAQLGGLRGRHQRLPRAAGTGHAALERLSRRPVV